MDRRQIGMKLTIDALGLPLKLGSFNDRLTLQKAIYLAQAAGVQLGYSHGWYIRGPYSPALARDAFAVAAEIAEGDDESSRWRLDDESRDRVRGLADIIPAGSSARRARNLELLASVHYLVTRRQVARTDDAQLAETLHKYGKRFSRDEIRAALDELSKYDLFPASSRRHSDR